MESAIEVFDFIDGLVHGCGDFEEAEVFRIDQFTSQQLARDEAVPVVPIVAPGSLEADDRLRVALAGLGEGQTLKTFVMRAKQVGTNDTEKAREASLALHPIGRLGTASDIAKGIVFLASDDAGFMTGAGLVVDGGWTAH